MEFSFSFRYDTLASCIGARVPAACAAVVATELCACLQLDGAWGETNPVDCVIGEAIETSRGGTEVSL
jgi:hypothetical protein